MKLLFVAEIYAEYLYGCWPGCQRRERLPRLKAVAGRIVSTCPGLALLQPHLTYPSRFCTRRRAHRALRACRVSAWCELRGALSSRRGPRLLGLQYACRLLPPLSHPSLAAGRA